MNNKPYQKFSTNDLILRDWLAIDRTILANKRTFLAYIRTSLALLISGATAIHFIESHWVNIFGIILIILAIIFLVVGILEYRKYQEDIAIILKGNLASNLKEQINNEN